MAQRLLVCAGRADEDELVGSIAEEPEVAFEVTGRERDPVHHGVEPVAGKRPFGSDLVANVRQERRGAAGATRIAPPVEEEELDAAFDGQARAGASDQAGAAHEEHLHSALPAPGRTGGAEAVIADESTAPDTPPVA